MLAKCLLSTPEQTLRNQVLTVSVRPTRDNRFPIYQANEALCT